MNSPQRSALVPTELPPPSTQIPPWMREAFAIIDRRDAAAFASSLGEHASFRFGNAPAVQGRAAIQAAVAGFFAALGGLSHTLERAWSNPDAQAVQGNVTYTRLNGTQVTIPFMDLFVRDADGEIQEWFIYSDLAPLFA